MQIVEKALKEIKEFFLFLNLGNSLLNSLIFFLLGLLFSNIFGFNWKYTIIPCVIYFVYLTQKNFRINKYYEVEKKVPSLNEQLRTVADNITRSNPIVDSLKDDVLKKMRNVKTEYFIDYKDIIIKISVLGGLSIIVIMLAFFNVDLSGTIGKKLITPLKEIGIRSTGQGPLYNNISVTEGNLSEILSNKSLAKLNKKELKLEINPLLSEVDPASITSVETQSFSPPNFPKEIYTSFDVSYNEKIARENQEVIKNYFEEISR